MKLSFPGSVTAETIEVRFPFSGKISAVNKKVGENVKQWEWLASLDKKLLQTELDKELLDYEKIRSAFDKDSTLQKTMEIAVKNVELAKARLDQAELISPVEGFVVESNLRVGLNATPAGNSVKVLDTSSYRFEFEISQAELEMFLKFQKVKISFFKGNNDDVTSETKPPMFGDKGKFKIICKLPSSDKILPGLEGEVLVIN